MAHCLLKKGMTNDVVKVIDIAPFVERPSHSDAERNLCAEQWDEAFSDVGFAVVVGHGVDLQLIRGMRCGFKSFFEGKDTAHKMKYSYGPYGNSKGGYTSLGGEAVARSQDGHGGLGNDDDDGGATTTKVRADPVESFVCKFRSDDDGSQMELPEEFCAVAARYDSEMRRVLESLNRISEVALKLPEGYLTQFYEPEPNCYLVAKYYPPSLTSGIDSETRYGAHTDYTGYTILKQDDSDAGEASGGLQVRLKSGEWKDVKPRPDGFVCNLGDLIEDWTNGRWKSAVHRVVAPQAGSNAAKVSRLSMPFFTGPHDDAVIETLATCMADGDATRLAAPIRAGDHLQRKLEATQV